MSLSKLYTYGWPVCHKYGSAYSICAVDRSSSFFGENSSLKSAGKSRCVFHASAQKTECVSLVPGADRGPAERGGVSRDQSSFPPGQEQTQIQPVCLTVPPRLTEKKLVLWHCFRFGYKISTFQIISMEQNVDLDPGLYNLHLVSLLLSLIVTVVSQDLFVVVSFALQL